MKRFFGAQDERDTKVGQEKKFGHAYQRAQVSRRFPLSHHAHKIFRLARRLTKAWAIIRFARRQKMKSFVEAQGEQVHFGAEDEQGMKVCREEMSATSVCRCSSKSTLFPRAIMPMRFFDRSPMIIKDLRNP